MNSTKSIPAAKATPSHASFVIFRTIIYAAALVTGAIVMSFEMLGSRYLNPYFGNGIYTWAALISTVLAALTVGYFIGGVIGDRTASATVLGAIVGLASVYLLALPGFAGAVLGRVADSIDDVRVGSLYAALAIMFAPVTLLGVYSPFAIRLVLRTAQQSGTVSGTIYGVSTAGSIIGTLGTTFFLIPLIGTRAITLLLGAAGLCCALLLIAFDRVLPRTKAAKSTTAVIAFTALMIAGTSARSSDLFDEAVRADMLKHSDGQVAHIETEYNNLFIDKHGSLLGLSSMFKGRPDYVESIVDLKDPDALPVSYNRIVPVALTYPPAADVSATMRILMIGMGAGSILTYLGRAMPDAQIDVVELDPDVIAAGKEYFGLRENDKVNFIDSDGRVYLNRHNKTYDLILLDAFRELGIPFHLLTKEFYELVKAHLAPGGAVASNVAANTKLYVSSLVTLRAVFPTVDVYPDWASPQFAQAIAVASPSPRPTTDMLLQRATALQQQFHFRYPLSDIVGKRITKEFSEGGELLTDDFAPADLYRVTPAGQMKQQ
ncbi:MAG TPA: fused MFS/spermidine synthase [Xanthobacteraceae bacterium]|nr:fused MFS/spermidine synthase [Xanthobacteraceae bacterium]